MTLDRYLERNRDGLTFDDRILTSSALLNVVPELHSHNIAHRDIGPRCIWIGSASTLAVSGFMACQLPGETSISDWLSTLRGYPSANRHTHLSGALRDTRGRGLVKTAGCRRRRAFNGR